MPDDPNGSYDWRERMRRIEDSMERNWADHDRINRNIEGLHASMQAQKENVDKLLGALRDIKSTAFHRRTCADIRRRAQGQLL